MDYKRVSKGLGLASIALGAAEVLAARRIARGLSMQGSARLIRGFGVREVTAGAGLLMAPAHSTRMWNRVAGDVMDLGALGLAARRAPKKKAVIGALAFVAGTTMLDWIVARGLDRKTGKAAPVRAGREVEPNAEETAPVEDIKGATSIEPARVADPEPPQVAVAPA